MENSKLVSFSIICLSISLIISSVIISKGLTDASSNVTYGLNNCSSSISSGLASSSQAVSTLPENDDFLALFDACQYLHMDEQSLRSYIGKSDSNIPYTTIGNSIIFSKKALNKWMEDKISKESGK
jgi:hypothetical protein